MGGVSGGQINMWWVGWELSGVAAFCLLSWSRNSNMERTTYTDVKSEDVIVYRLILLYILN